jgi:lipopolysaccharide/colanic/teichoic acid biosynthesis glycosyltransferase
MSMTNKNQGFQQFIKWIADRVGATIALLIFSPILLIITIAIYLRMGSPILFTQPRPGRHGRIFTFYKFRTMTNERDANGNLLPDEQRLTQFGAFLRKTSLDELPQLWNIIKGDMSFVGPRPLIVEYLPLYTVEQARRHDVLPGVTGWAQVNGRRLLDQCWEKKFQLDVWYIDHWNLWLDLKILWMTVWQVLQRKGISQPGHVTSEYFKGQPSSVYEEVP